MKELNTALEERLCLSESFDLVRRVLQAASGSYYFYFVDGFVKDEIMEKMGESAIFAPAHANRQRAAAVGALAQVYFAQGIYESADEFVPDYLRKSQAEREREERLHGQK